VTYSALGASQSTGRAAHGIEVLIVEDHRLLADGLTAALCRRGIESCAVYPTRVADVVETACRLRPSLVLLDLDLGLIDGDGSNAVPPLADAGMYTVLLTGSRDRDALARCLEGGAQGVISKAGTLDDVIDAVQRALRGEPSPGRDERNALLAERRERELRQQRKLAPFQSLSRRESDVLRALADGRSVEVIANESYVSVATVRSQVRSILLKLGVNSQLAAVAVARQSGWLESDAVGRC
jgi:DNA-binding NarL/FixJ family response regulator